MPLNCQNTVITFLNKGIPNAITVPGCSNEQKFNKFMFNSYKKCHRSLMTLCHHHQTRQSKGPLKQYLT